MVRPRPIWLSLLTLSNTFWWVLGVCNCSLGQHVNDTILLVYGNAQTSSNMCWLVASVLNNPQYTKVEYFENLLAGQTLKYKTSYILGSYMPLKNWLNPKSWGSWQWRCEMHMYLHIFKLTLQIKWIAS